MPSKLLIPHRGRVMGRDKHYGSANKRVGGALRALATQSQNRPSNAGVLHKEFTRMSVNAQAPRKKKYLSF